MSYESDQAAKRAAYARGMLNDEAYSLQSRPRSEADTRRSAALHSAEREVLERVGPVVSDTLLYADVSTVDHPKLDALRHSYRRYRALLDKAKDEWVQ